MSRMREVTVDPDARLAHVGPGCLLGDVDQATQAHGLATVLGFVSEIGVAGLTLGGGFGYLTRRFGWTVDNLDEVEIVTADGQIRTANRDENADLFWALRGGGGNFGVVTRFTFRLHEVGPTITGGLIVWSAERADEVLAGLPRPHRVGAARADRGRDRAPGAAGPVPPPGSGTASPSSGSWCATAAPTPTPTSRRFAPSATRSSTCVAQKPYVDLQSMLDGMEPKGLHCYWKTEFLPGPVDEFLDAFRDSAPEGDRRRCRSRSSSTSPVR